MWSRFAWRVHLTGGALQQLRLGALHPVAGKITRRASPCLNSYPGHAGAIEGAIGRHQAVAGLVAPQSWRAHGQDIFGFITANQSRVGQDAATPVCRSTIGVTGLSARPFVAGGKRGEERAHWKDALDGP